MRDDDRYDMDEDAVLDELEEMQAEGGLVVDHHGSDFFPERWFSLVVVLRASPALIKARLMQRGYVHARRESHTRAH